jgi:hypothetical protein
LKRAFQFGAKCVAEKAEQGRRQMLGVAKADLQLEEACANRSPSLSTRTIGVPGPSRWRVVASRAARVHQAHRRRGIEGSNPSPSSGESDANLTRNREKGCDVSVVEKQRRS